MSGRALSCGVFLFLYLGNGSAVRKLNSINDLKEINFGQSVPKHSLILLHWFANVINIDNNGFIHLTFDLGREDYGSHYYSNFERLLNLPPTGHRYYTVGNIYQDTPVQLPHYVVNPPRGYEAENRDRIIISVQRRGHSQIINQVYLTQHYGAYEHQGTRYDQDHTYQITTNLLRDLRLFSLRDNQTPLSHLRNQFGSNVNESQLRDIRNRWGDLCCLGLLLFIVIEKTQPPNIPNRCRDFVIAIGLFLLIFILILFMSERR